MHDNENNKFATLIIRNPNSTKLIEDLARNAGINPLSIREEWKQGLQNT